MLTSPTRGSSFDPQAREGMKKASQDKTIRKQIFNDNQSTSRRSKGYIMAKENISPEYYENLLKFMARVENDQQRALDEEGHTDRLAKIIHETGRKFDKVLLMVVKRDAIKGVKLGDARVMYFVDRATGKIYAPKSPLAPNTKWHFGKIENAHKWDWSGENGRNVSDDSVKEVGKYGNYTHYVDVDDDLAAAS